MKLQATHGDLFIDGRPVATDRRIEVRDPGRTADVVATIAEAGAEHVAAAVAAATLAGPGWAATPLQERLNLLADALAAVRARIDDLAPILARENGGTLFESTMDLSRGADLFDDFLGRAPGVLGERTTDNGQHWLSVARRPVGVCALIVPWNSPVVLTVSKLAPALIAGNTAVVKPSILAPVVVAEVLRTVAALLPPGVVNVVHGDAEVGHALVAHSGVRKVSFTGSVAVGRQIMATAADGVKRVSLELGGNDPAILLDDVDLDAATHLLARGIYTRAGQICFAVKRLYVPRARHDEVVEAIASVVDGYRVGHGLDEQATFGPLITAAARARVEGLLARARAAGGAVRELGRPTDSVDWDGGHYLLPHLVTGLDQSAELVEVEQFGPVVPVIAYDDVDQAVAMANDSDFGLCSSVWSADVDRAVAVARGIEAGATFINSHNVSSLSFDMPFGGVKHSGIGRERTELGLLEYVEEHAIRLAH
ncbi:aldehyde dehydrogenase family protein [Acrocarpospora catenulata]|uniref:aldehyde dehydrogenase family protein n=1 Tax=Acrocarpospora catenulata TaxID=2836182 RepID=UPI001BDB5CEF|nr:aldehyde dehydrogenase family protein [Acrocarpospora catenulata]